MNRELLRELIYAHGVSGRERSIAKLIENKISPYVDSLVTDNVGNLIAHKKGKGKKLLLIASMDTVGLYVDYIMPDGKIRVSGVRGIDYSEIAGKEVISENGVIGKLFADEAERELDYDKVCIDIGTNSKSESLSKIKIADSFMIKPSLRKHKDTEYESEYFDNRISCYALIEAIKSIKNPKYDLYFAFTTQHKDMHFGSRNAVYQIEPDYVISLCIAKAPEVKVGEGPAIKIKDKSAICSQEIIELIEKSAKSAKIKTQYELDEKGLSDTAHLRTIKRGCEVGAIALALKGLDNGKSVVDFNDVEKNISLLKEIIEVKK